MNLLKEKENELLNSNQLVDKLMEEKEKLRKKLDETININEINYLKDQMKIAQKKYDELKKEKEYLTKIKEEHQTKCKENFQKLEKEAEELKNKIKELKNKQKETQITENKGIILSKCSKKIISGGGRGGLRIGNNLNTNDTIRLEIEKRKRFEEKAKNSLKNFWEKNEQKFLSLSEGNIEQNLSSNNLTSTNKRGNKLPSISLFKKVEEKKILAKIIPEKELEKYDKRYQMIYNEKKKFTKIIKIRRKKIKK